MTDIIMHLFKSLALTILLLPAMAEAFPIQYNNVRFSHLGTGDGLPHSSGWLLREDSAGMTDTV